MTNKKQDFLIGTVEVPSITEDYNSKFILIKEPTLEGDKSQFTLLCRKVYYHMDIVKSLKQEGKNFTMYGGGWLRFNNGTITSHGESFGYGIADVEKVKIILSDWCEKNKFSFENQMEEVNYL